MSQDFCMCCGDDVPPRDGEGTCPICDPPTDFSALAKSQADFEAGRFRNATDILNDLKNRPTL